MNRIPFITTRTGVLAGLFAAMVGCGNLSAQVVLKKEFPTKEPIGLMDNSTFRVAYTSSLGLCTLRDYVVVNNQKISVFAFNPAGSSLAVVSPKKNIRIYSFNEANDRLFTLKEKRKEYKGANVLSMCYSDNARYFIAATDKNEIIIYDTRSYMPQAYIQTSVPATTLAMSSNNYFIAAVNGKGIDIWNFQTRELRTRIEVGSVVEGCAFSADASMLAVTTADKGLVIYDTRNWTESQRFDWKGSLSCPSFHPDGKYVLAVKDNRNILIANLKTAALEQEIEIENAGTFFSRFFANNQTKDMYLLSGHLNKLTFWDANGLNPFYGKIVSSEVDAKMNEWVKMMQGESMEEYAIRVNDETRLKQQMKYEQEVATRLAGDRISMENPFVGNYDSANGLLSVGFNTMPSISLEVPVEDLGSFGDAGNLTFENAVYTLNENDEFELAYVEVKNETTNKVYIFDNIGRKKLTALKDESVFVPLEIMQQASREEAALQVIKETVVTENKQDRLITDNTQINVKTEVVPSVNADGEKILNYKVGYQYEVINESFSANEDFPSGGFDISKSNAAMSLMKIIKSAFEGDFSSYLGKGKQVKVIVTGSADASPIRSKIAYKGQYGEFVNEPYYKDGNLDNITVTKASGITENEQLALLRAAGVVDYIRNNIETLKDTQNEYEYHVEVAKERGGEYRRINVEFIIVDAFPVAEQAK